MDDGFSILAMFPQLHILNLYYCEIPSLRFLQSMPHLRELRIDCADVPIEDLTYLHTLKHLRHLQFKKVFREPIPNEVRANYMPPSRLIPSAEHVYLD
jgi:hypothetical protein